MQYMLLIYDNEKNFGSYSEADGKKMMAEYMAYTKAMVDEGVFRAGDPLKATTTATTVRVRDGKTLKTDGPFAETKEQLGGYYIIDVPNLDKALEWAARCPSARMGSIEVRPVMEMPKG